MLFQTFGNIPTLYDHKHASDSQPDFRATQQPSLFDLYTEMLPQALTTAQIAKNIQNLSTWSKQLTTTVKSTKDQAIRVDRLIVGNGVAGTLVYDQLPMMYRESEQGGIPNVLVIADPAQTYQWDKHQLALMGQPESVQCPVAFTHHPSEYSKFLRDAKQESRFNPYHYTRGTDFSHALRATQADIGMKTLPAVLLKVEKQDMTADWDKAMNAFPYRATIKVEGEEKQIYTHHIDICTGFGASRKLYETDYIHRHSKTKKEKQIDPDLSKKLIAEGKLIYANDNGYPELKGEVVVFGGSAMSAAIVTDVLSKDNVKLVKWVSGSVKDLNDTRDTNRMNKKMLEDDLDKYLSVLSLGDIKKVEEFNGRLKVTFEPATSVPGETGLIAEKIVRPETEFTLICDHLVVGIGSENKIAQLFSQADFEPLYSSAVKGREQIQVGTQSKDGCLVAWGAAGRSGFGLKDKEWAAYAEHRDKGKLSEYLQTLPPESRGLGTVLAAERAILTAAKTLRKKKQLPADDKCKRKKNINNVSQLQLEVRISKILAGIYSLSKNESLLSITQAEIERTAKDYAKLIIEERKRNPEGITISKLRKLDLPQPLIVDLAKAYYFFLDDEDTVEDQLVMMSINELPFSAPQMTTTHQHSDHHCQRRLQ